MATKKQVKKSIGSNHAVAIVGALGVVAAAAAGTYFFYGSKNAASNRKLLKGWVLKAKGEVLEKLENLKEVDEKVYQQVVDTVLKKYESLKNVDAKDIAAISKELKTHWKSIQKELKKTSKKAVKKLSGR